MDVNVYYIKYDELKKKYPMWRKGQLTFNTMYDLYPDVANKYRGSSIDPFHDDTKITDFINKCFSE